MSYKIKTKEKSEKRWTKKKIVAASVLGLAVLSFVVVLILAAIFQLDPVRPIKSSEEDLRIIGEIGGFEVRYEELKYFASVRAQELDESLGEYESLDAVAKSEYEKLLHELVVEDICDVYAIYSLCADLDIDTDSDEADDFVQKKVEELIDGKFDGDKREYKKWLEEGFITDSVLRRLYRVSYLEAEIIDSLRESETGILYDADNIGEFIDYVAESNEWIRTIHAFYPKKSDVIDTSNSIVRAKEAADTLALISDDDKRYIAMNTVIGKAPFVSGFSTTGNGFYFSLGQMGEEYENAAFSLEEYGVSGVIETADGYYVIMRLPTDKEQIASNREALLTNYQYGVLKKYTDDKKKEIPFVKHAYYDEIDLFELK